MVEIDGQQEETLVLEYNSKDIAICKKFQREERKRREARNSSNSTPTPPSNGGR